MLNRLEVIWKFATNCLKWKRNDETHSLITGSLIDPPLFASVITISVTFTTTLNWMFQLLVLISVILIFTAPGVCYTRYINDIQVTDEICPSENFLPMGINRWSNGVHFQHRGQKYHFLLNWYNFCKSIKCKIPLCFLLSYVKCSSHFIFLHENFDLAY